MSENLRQTLALFALFGGGGAIYFGYGAYGLGLAGFGFFLCWAVIGLATGYWVGRGRDRIVIEAMRWAKDRAVRLD